jgi:sugar/nucleoside kinase (ribokinase family)
MISDSEARELSEEPNLIKGARRISSFGPKSIVIKKGEHGILFFHNENFCFSVPAYPLKDVFDPTGCGDSFAGGFIGYLAQQGEINESILRKAVIYGSIIASFNAESFGIDRLVTLTMREVEKRVREFKRLTQW